MVEEAPSPVVTPEIREAMCASAIQIAGHIKYENAGTVEFILDQAENKFYFLEMNTRIQVEHPVTEMITGVDLVKEQFKVASEHAFSFSQKDLSLSGHAIECRINAELPQADFRPCPGKITMWEPPSGEGIRLDTHCYAEYFVPPYYDSLLAKLITADSDRSNTIGKMQRALDSFVVGGVDTTISFYKFVMKNRDYIKGSINTRWIEEILLKEFEKDEGNKIS
jgi:acetyl-CoA carboxylase biotin carboxylase subunit